MKFFLILATVALAAASVSTEDHDAAAASRFRWIPLNIPIPGPAAGTPPAANTGACPGGNPQGCLTCDTTTPTRCGTTPADKGFCYDRTLAYPVGCPGSATGAVYCQTTCR